MRNNSFILHQYFNSLKRYSFNELDTIKELNGIYILFEKGEKFADMDRVVLVGTHNRQNGLVKRLAEHIKHNKDRSILRKHIGRAILNRNDQQELLKQWNRDLTPRENYEYWNDKLDYVGLDIIEQVVSYYVQKNLTFAIIPFETAQERSLWKSRIIATLAKANILVNGAVMSSEVWLGKFATNANIVKRGMWVVQNLGGEELTDEEVDDLIK